MKWVKLLWASLFLSGCVSYNHNHNQVIYTVVESKSCQEGLVLALCDAGDQVIGGGGSCVIANSTCGTLHTMEASKPIYHSGDNNNQEGWFLFCDSDGNAAADGGEATAICLKSN